MNMRTFPGWIAKFFLAVFCLYLLGCSATDVSAREKAPDEIEPIPTIAEAIAPEACNYLATGGNTIDSLWTILSDNGDGTISADWAQNDTDCYAWNAFVALNWPSVGQSNSGNSDAQPDSSQTIGDAGFVVWQRWKNTDDVFLPNGVAPAGWDPYIGPPEAVVEQAQEGGLCVAADCSSDPFHDIRLIQQASGLVFKSNESLDGTPIRYEIEQNESTFDFIVDRGIYSINGQEALAASCPQPTEWPPLDSDRCASFPRNSVETKASWLWVPADSSQLDEIKNLYITAIGYYQLYDNNGDPILDGNGDPTYEVGLVALTGLHVTTKALPDWVWTTFENKYNYQYTQSTIEVPIPPETELINDEYQTWLAAQGTPNASKYANYLLVGTQIEFDGPPDIQGGELLANSQIESHFQFASSCITCHAFSSVTERTDLPLQYSFVDSRGGNLTYFVGSIPDEVKADIISKGYRDLDYVWSLRLAKRQKEAVISDLAD